MDDFELEDAARSAFESALSFGIGVDSFIRLAKQVRAAEREACAKVCDSLYDESKLACGGPPTAEDAAKAIRGR